MSYSEIATLLDTIAEMTDTPDTLDGAVSTDWFIVAMNVHSLVREAKAQVEDGIDEMYAEMIARHEEHLDAQADATSSGWGWD